ncbi:MAG: tetratricopeptide repeat protein, partial [Phycisphaerales bacterium]|nr:tetratricopeptide repeat protein [Phycisphaerales bacterium]
LDALAAHSSVQYELGDYGAALASAESLLDIRRRTPDTAPADLALAINNVGWLSFNLGEMERAETLHEEALRIRRKEFGDRSLPVAESLSNLGVVYAETARCAEAVNLHQDALKIREERLGHDHPKVAESLGNIAVALECDKQPDLALEYYLKSLEIERRLNVPELSSSLVNIGRLYARMQRFDEAEAHVNEALELDRAVRGEDHAYVAYDLRILAGILNSGGNVERAESCLRRALDIVERLDTASEYELGVVQADYARFLFRQKRFAEAEPLYRAALTAATNVYGIDHYRTARLRVGVIDCLYRQGKYEDVEPLLLEFYDWHCAHRDINDTDGRGLRKRLRSLYTRFDKPDLVAKYTLPGDIKPTDDNADPDPDTDGNGDGA